MSLDTLCYTMRDRLRHRLRDRFYSRLL